MLHAAAIVFASLAIASPAFAQSASQGGFDFSFLLMMALLFGVMYFLLIRPQQKRQKEHRSMIETIRRGDVIVTGGGLIAKVIKVIDDNEIQAEIADGVRVRVVKSTVVDVRGKGEPAQVAETKPARGKKKKGDDKSAAGGDAANDASADKPVDKPAND